MKREEIQAGLYGKIIDTGYIYSKYVSWLEKHAYTYFRHFHDGQDPSEQELADEFIIVGHGEHGAYDNYLLAVQSVYDGNVYIVEKDGFKLTDQNNIEFTSCLPL